MDAGLWLAAGMTLLAGLGWWAFSRGRKRVGELEVEIRALQDALQARNAQDEAFDRSRGSDLDDDRRWLPGPQ